MSILIFNPGSSSLKYAWYGTPPLDGNEEHGGGSGMPEAVAAILRRIPSDDVTAIGCRVVHGGPRFIQPTVVDKSVLASLRELSDLAPLHNPPAIQVIEELRRTLPAVPIVAAFDTAFHQTLPPVASTYALPRDLRERFQLRRYGFHGLSHAYVSRQLLLRLGRAPASTRLITCHLGNGASVCAIRDGESIDVSMGFTPMEGLVMGTRAGDLDPGLLLYLLRHGVETGTLDRLLNHDSGLLGLSEISADVRELEQAESAGEARARLALDLFAYKVAKTIGAYAAALEGIDAIAFTAGIGEGSASMRRRICSRLAFLGITLDADANEAPRRNARRISKGAVDVWVIPTDEESEIAQLVAATLGLAKPAAASV